MDKNVSKLVLDFLCKRECKEILVDVVCIT